MTEHSTVSGCAESEFEIKKSRFLSAIWHVGSIEDANAMIEKRRREHWDARHNCFAMILGEKREFMKMSDDGEPQGTAGVPMLEVLKQSGLTDVLVIVTRYFGGILLGAGGLARAYTKGAADAVAAADKISLIPAGIYKVTVPYTLWGRTEAAIKADGHEIADVSYTDEIDASVVIRAGAEGAFSKRLAEISAGGAAPVKTGETYIVKKII